MRRETKGRPFFVSECDSLCQVGARHKNSGNPLKSRETAILQGIGVTGLEPAAS